jgi:hypothetical protein
MGAIEAEPVPPAEGTPDDGATPVLAPLYDPVCVAAFFEGVPATDRVRRCIESRLAGGVALAR